jgi:hypothetical protein
MASGVEKVTLVSRRGAVQGSNPPGYYLTLVIGGLLIMTGQLTRSEALFYYFKLEEYIPESHLLRLIDKHIDFGFVREQRKGTRKRGSPSARVQKT